MTRKKIVGIHIPNAEKLTTSMLLEQLRYAGVMSRANKHNDKVYPSSDGQSPIEILYVPEGMNKINWTHQNVARMKSFGINATIVEE